ncbi:hypothetical protein PSN45_000622 [Yamadazyma tenuis]|uniref:Transcription initiation factor TFIID subunit 13 n=1 Tax=Candida tenuis (strain ATCC 10573 / BCRC 21748 / CBS 615 / JCM 9827 / NBRC 10315 / NRRL Y-1498 / VKM Y-70) TaxID=590646 RepID=G3B9M4_CANTC|nr:TFIID-18kDa-domain-containing protein [Yamadazyma tenuis ATCC 10573]XP_006688873.1 uncharacterized protein CANTEDRAFT_115379 [Yamadazyma tenuis ATCC 10573]EGV62702.1 TFIID-18kDa-domain-containing protein [Yamadazyma tenuis ATCC 10573]EGV62703.1 hypothetical protein CANTEDRAFT_115379 [Yamadazyma tenuis ATCC 10573]WEJ93161.1 hypothetical protein PSN45_000622 [Yamadazyma tenuis]
MSVNTSRKRRKQRLFSKDIEQLLYALGDGPYSMESTINALEDSLVEYLSDLSTATQIYARSKNRNRIKVDDLPFTLRNDPYKLSRLQYIVNQSQKIENAKKIFDEDDKKLADYGDEDDDEDDDDEQLSKPAEDEEPSGKKFKKSKKKGRQ